MSNLHKQHYSFSTLLWKYRRFWNKNVQTLDSRDSNPNLRTHAEWTNHLSYRGQIYPVWCFGCIDIFVC